MAKRLPPIDALTASRWCQQKGQVLVDIRSASDWAQGVPTDAVLINATSLATQNSIQPAHYEHIYLLCYRGVLSQQWADKLGPPYQSVEGGYAAWQAAGLSTHIPSVKTDEVRYDRQIKVIGATAQQKLTDAHILVVGAGGLGAAALLYLAGSGVGRITLMDDDKVALHNLHRQVIYREQDVGQTKAETAAMHMQELNSTIQVDAIDQALNSDNAERFMAPVDLIIDGTDNIKTRYLINDLSLRLNKPWVFAAVADFDIQLAFFTGDKKYPCYRCLFPDLSDQQMTNCAEGGILGPVPGMAAMLQCLEAVKFLTGCGPLLTQQLLSYDVLHHQFKVLKYPPDNPCTH